MKTPGVRCHILSAGAALFLLFAGGRAAAFHVKSAFTEPCHEQMVASSLECVNGGLFGPAVVSCASSPLFPPVSHPIDPVTDSVADWFADAVGVFAQTDGERLSFLSLVVGIRYPDVKDSSVYHLVNMRYGLLLDEFEPMHFIRRSFDDGPEGDTAAIAAARDFISSTLAEALAVARGPESERYRFHTVSIDFYGEVDVRLYEPLFLTGVALHTFQDSFSHTLRSDDLHTIVSVVNAVEAFSGNLEEERDGIAHSAAMDRCMEEAWSLATMAGVATSELLAAVNQEASGENTGRIDAVLDDWLAFEPGCTIDNGYCNSGWLDLARKDSFKPVISMLTGCSAALPGYGFPAGLVQIFVMLTGGAAVGSWRKRR